MKALFICTGSKVSTWLSEITHPYWHLIERGVEIDFATPEGGQIFWDPMSDPNTPNSAEPDDLVSKGFLSDPALVALLGAALPLKDLDLSAYDAVHVAGGLGAIFDLFPNDDVARVLEHFWAKDKVIGAICHGAIALANNPDRLGGRHVTGYTTAEDHALEERFGDQIQIPQYPQEALEKAGAVFRGLAPNAPFVVRDGKLLTGQNQFSASEYGILLYHLMAGGNSLETY